MLSIVLDNITTTTTTNNNAMTNAKQAYAPADLEHAAKELNLDPADTGNEDFAVTAVAASPSGDELAVGLRNGDVKLYELPSLEFKSMLTRFTAPVLGLDYGMRDGGVM